MKNVNYNLEYDIGDIVYYPIIATNSEVIKSKVEEIHIRRLHDNTVGIEYVLSAVNSSSITKNYVTVVPSNKLYANYDDAKEYLDNILQNL